MAKQIGHEAIIPNPALKDFSVLLGNWTTTGSHRLISHPLHGRASFEWAEGGAFLMMRSEIDEPEVPSAVSIIGSDDAAKAYFMLYFDERGISRKFDVSMSGNVLKYWRIIPGFSQRFTGTLSEDGNTIVGLSELCEDDVTWMRDLELTFQREK